MKFLLLFLALLPASAESLHYVINWPSGMSLGEASWSSNLVHQQIGAASNDSGTLSLDIDASLPSFTIRDHYSSAVNGNLCSVEIDKKYVHGTRTDDETIKINQNDHTAVRTGLNGVAGPPFTVATCARDPLAFLQFVREELAEGRVPASEALVFGSIYHVSLANTGIEQVKLGGKTVPADHVVASVTGPASKFTVEILFAQNPGRTPVLFRVPLALGTFTVELTH